ncbi:hypothetical protein ACWC24_41790 [Streptomyces sp. NPDC001443]
MAVLAHEPSVDDHQVEDGRQARITQLRQGASAGGQQLDRAFASGSAIEVVEVETAHVEKGPQSLRWKPPWHGSFMPKRGGSFRWGTSPEPWNFLFAFSPQPR